MGRLNDRLAKLETAARHITGKLHMFFVWESWDRERVLDDYGWDKIADGDTVQFLVWKDSHLDEPMPYRPDCRIPSHWSDCAVYNAPALPPGECDCEGLDLSEDASHDAVGSLVSGSGSAGGLSSDSKAGGLIKPHKLPPSGLSAHTSPSDLPDAHDVIPLRRNPDGVDFNDA